MPNRIEYKANDIVGSCVYLHDVPTTDNCRRALFICRCGNKFEARLSHVKGSKIVSCSCYKNKNTGNRARRHGLTNHYLYNTWCDIKKRCFVPGSTNYWNYGARGIAVHGLWRNDFKAFFDYVTKLPHYDIDKIGKGKGLLTLDRIDNDGNYEPGNLRWANYHTQSLNSRMKSNNTSGYTGVSYNLRSKKWVSNIRVNGKLIHLGYHTRQLSAVQARNQYIIENKLFEYKLQNV